MTLPETIAKTLGFGADPGVGGQIVGGLIGGFLIVNVIMVLSALTGPWLKRKMYADFTQRYAVNRVGPFGLLIIVADALRLMTKELIVPEGVDRPAWDLAPIVTVFSALVGFAVIPMGSIAGVSFQIADPEIGLAFALAVAALASIGEVMAGYSSDNKYALIGTLRVIAQDIAYEIPLVLTAASVVIFTGSLQTSSIVARQAETLVTVAGVSIPSWYAIVNPFAFVLFLAASLAEVARNPFDGPEAATEIVAGYMTEYGSVYFTLLYLSEFLHIFLGGAIVATVFLGGPAGPVLPGFVWMLVKIMGFFAFTQWCRYSIPRVRMDQVIEIGWKGMLVLSFVNLVLTAVIVGVVVG
jgi:NADH-quinone oxidoreductase subunit H